MDRVFLAAATAANKARIRLAKMAVKETGMGVVEDKVIKNHYRLHGANVIAMHWCCHPTPYGFSNLEYYLIQSAFSYCGTLLHGLLVCVLSSLLPSRLTLPVGLVITLITEFPNTSFASSDKCFSLWQKLTALTPGQMMGGFSTIQTYQFYEFGPLIIQLQWQRS